MGFSNLPPIFQPTTATPGTQPPKVYGQATDPTSTAGFKPGQAVLNTVSGDLFQLTLQNGAYGWQLLTNLKGPAGIPGDGHLNPEELAAVVTEIEADMESDIDPVLLFENALIP